MTKQAIFHYIYAVLHDPIYRQKYALNLKRELPRIPFYADFWRWVAWGEKLMTLHIGYEAVKPWPVDVLRPRKRKAREAELPPKPILKADRENDIIQLDTDTQLTGVPKEAWEYRLGSRSALEWILDQYRERTPNDSTIAAKFNQYRFPDYKEDVIERLRRVIRVSVESAKIVSDMRAAKR
jgi:predicted helicase